MTSLSSRQQCAPGEETASYAGFAKAASLFGSYPV